MSKETRRKFYGRSKEAAILTPCSGTGKDITNIFVYIRKHMLVDEM